MKKTTYLIDTENVGSVWKALLDRMDGQDKLLLFYTENSPGISYADLQSLLTSGKSFEFFSCHTGKNGLDFQLISYLGYLLHSWPKSRLVVLSDDTGYDPALQFWTEKGFEVQRMTKAMLRAAKKESVKPRKADSAVVPVAKTLPLQKAEPVAEPAASSSRRRSSKRGKVVRSKPLKPALMPETAELSKPKAENVRPETGKSGTNKVLLEAVTNVLPDCVEGDRIRISNILKGHTYHDKQEIHYELVKEFGETSGVAHYRKLRPHLYDLYQSIGA